MRCLTALALILLLADLVLGQDYDDVQNNNYNFNARKRHFEKINKAICYSKPDYGKCKGNRQLWFFNKYKIKCEKFTYSNCGGNENRFYTKDECDIFCTEKSKDWLRKDTAHVA
ncbi:PREDICTED: protease inhibitor carrapatin-like [Drosophila arizonae]|uniref:Protease inhibitor carrapatin-like n=1 Tax=Drosophila arizonae TaxID=7263 RepID=A0ABM1NVD6_DROAR|nr:PREDICTED: protease inhibitor carrapatin-like [Drosophila arizonae]